MKRRLQKPLAVKVDRVSQKKVVFKVLNEGESISDFYETEEQIYEGGNKGKVMKAKKKGAQAGAEDCVLKIRYKRADKESERVWRTVMEQLITSKNNNDSSPHVLDLHEVLEDDKAFYIIMPNCSGGELFDFLLNETEVPEIECKRIIREILLALHDLHSKGLIHRDVKPENIMFDVQEGNTSKSVPGAARVKLINGSDTSPQTSKTVKLIDFDTCQPWTPESPKNCRFAGTPGYIAPESLLGNPGPQSDLWSVGVILYILMTGDMPWSGPLPELDNAQVASHSAKKMYEHLRGEDVDWTSPPWPEFPKARDLCQKLLKFECDERMQSAEEALKHQWLRES